MRSELFEKEASLREKFSRHGLKTQDYFIHLIGRNPSSSGSFLVSHGAFMSFLAEKVVEKEAVILDPEHAFDMAIQDVDQALFEQCTVHLSICLQHLDGFTTKLFIKYTNIIAKNPEYTLSGDFSASKILQKTFETYRARTAMLLTKGYVDLSEDIEAWETHFSMFYELICQYQKAISEMSRLIEIQGKKHSDSVGLKLKWIGAVVAVIGLTLAACNLYVNLN